MSRVNQYPTQNVALAHSLEKAEVRRYVYVLQVRTPQVGNSTLRKASSDGMHGFEGRKMNRGSELELDLRMEDCDVETDAKIPEARNSANAECSA